jgi:hypothetical protein
MEPGMFPMFEEVFRYTVFLSENRCLSVGLLSVCLNLASKLAIMARAHELPYVPWHAIICLISIFF